jgi:hypothetical protein
MTCWKQGVYLDLPDGAVLNIPNRYPVDVYCCPQCGKLELFRANFVPKPPAQESAEPDSVDTTGYYTPGVQADVKCPVCGKLHPADDLFCPLCGTRRDKPCARCGRWFPAALDACPYCGMRR